MIFNVELKKLYTTFLHVLNKVILPGEYVSSYVIKSKTECVYEYT